MMGEADERVLELVEGIRDAIYTRLDLVEREMRELSGHFESSRNTPGLHETVRDHTKQISDLNDGLRTIKAQLWALMLGCALAVAGGVGKWMFS